MKKSELKKILKPIVSECIKESLLEDGMISGIIAEVVKGMNNTPRVLEAATPPVDPTQERMRRNAFTVEQKDKLKTHRHKLMDAIGKDSYNGVNLFEGTTPAPAQMSPSQQAAPLAGTAPGDAGVDISNLFGAVGNSWNAHMSDVKEGK